MRQLFSSICTIAKDLTEEAACALTYTALVGKPFAR
jgi:hypothetical protein